MSVLGVQKGVVVNVEQIHKYIKELKQVRRCLLQNVYLSDGELSDIISKNKLYFHYLDDAYLLLYKKEHDYWRLYYYIADIEQFKMEDWSGSVVCEVFFQKITENLSSLFSAFVSAGLNEYARFSKYTRLNVGERVNEDFSHIRIGAQGVFYEALLTCFDRYTDYLPEEGEVNVFLKNNICYSYIDDNGKFCGGAVISIKGRVATEEFVFVLPENRGQGISKNLHKYCYNNIEIISSQKIDRFVSWVNDENENSWKYLLNAGYNVKNEHKITFLKGE